MSHYALITGASVGLGALFAKKFAQDKINVILVARREDKLKTLAEELSHNFGIEAVVLPKDLSKPEAAEELYQEVSARGWPVDFLVNNAGFGDYGFYHETDFQKENEMLQLNIVCLTQLTKLFGHDMVKRRRGKILNVASTAAFFSGPMMTVYYASKNYVLSYSEALRNEWKDFGVSVTVLCPGPTETEFLSRAGLQKSKLIQAAMASAESVVDYGYQGMMRGKAIAIPGLMNRIQAFLPRLVSRRLMVKIIRRVQQQRNSPQD